MSPPEPVSSPGPPKTPSPSHPSHRERRALRWGLVVSVGVHLILLLAVPFVMERMNPEFERTDREEREWTVPSLQIVFLREMPDPESPDAEPEVEVLPETTPPDPPETAVQLVDPEAVEPPPVRDADDDVEEATEEAERLSILERLQPPPTDPRLWLGLEEHAELTDVERAELLLHGMIRNWNDSMAVAAALQRDAMDWTYTDDEGRRWGLSPGQLHLGDYSIPLPFSFDVPPGQRERARQWIYSDIDRGAVSAEMRETWAERAREIRRRMDEERDRRRGGGGGGGT